MPIPLKTITVKPISQPVARDLIRRHHYLHSYPGGTLVAFGVFVSDRLLGALTLGVGPINAHRLVDGAVRQDVLTLTRLWLDDQLPRNSESRVIGLMIRSLRKESSVKFVLSYADPAQGHVGTIYQATNWLYTGVCQAQPHMDLGDGIPRHLRSVASALGTHSKKYLDQMGFEVRFVPASGKHRYVIFVDRRWQDRLRVPVLPYPKRGEGRENSSSAC